jgi:hypothetical protein
MLKHWKQTFEITSFNMMHRYFPLADSHKPDNHLTDRQTARRAEGAYIALDISRLYLYEVHPSYILSPPKGGPLCYTGPGYKGLWTYTPFHPSPRTPCPYPSLSDFPLPTPFSFAPLTPYLLYPQGLD